MDKIAKFLKQLTKKERDHLKKEIFLKIRNLNTKNLDVKKVKGYPLWRVRCGRIRILFAKQNDQGVLVKIGFRKDIYKGL